MIRCCCPCSSFIEEGEGEEKKEEEEEKAEITRRSRRKEKSIFPQWILKILAESWSNSYIKKIHQNPCCFLLGWLLHEWLLNIKLPWLLFESLVCGSGWPAGRGGLPEKIFFYRGHVYENILLIFWALKWTLSHSENPTTRKDLPLSGSYK